MSQWSNLTGVGDIQYQWHATLAYQFGLSFKILKQDCPCWPHAYSYRDVSQASGTDVIPSCGISIMLAWYGLLVCRCILKQPERLGRVTGVRVQQSIRDKSFFSRKEGAWKIPVTNINDIAMKQAKYYLILHLQMTCLKGYIYIAKIHFFSH